MSESDEKKAGGALAQLIKEVFAFIPKEIREMIGVIGGMYLFVSIPILIFAAVKLVQTTADKAGEPSEHCWQIQKVEDRLFKLNACTGETVEMPQAALGSQPSQPALK